MDDLCDLQTINLPRGMVGIWCHENRFFLGHFDFPGNLAPQLVVKCRTVVMTIKDHVDMVQIGKGGRMVSIPRIKKVKLKELRGGKDVSQKGSPR